MLEAPTLEQLNEKAVEADRRHALMSRAVFEFSNKSFLPEIVKDQIAALDFNNPYKKRVLVLYYGGTLGMHEENLPDGTIQLVPTDDARKLLDPLNARGLAERMQVVWFPVFPAIDSTDARWPHWVSIANAIELLYDDFDGFAIAGGTDTKDHLMAAMHFIYPNFGKPIIGIAAQQRQEEYGEDATQNLSFGLQVAIEDIRGAHLAFHNKLLHGLHIFKDKDQDYDAFVSPPQYELGRFRQGKVVLYDNQPRRENIVVRRRLQVNKNFRDGIKLIKQSPFMWGDSLIHDANDMNAHVLLLETYGAGNVRGLPMFEGELTLVDALRALHQRKFPVVLGSPMKDGAIDSSYKSGVDALKAGAISGGDTTGAALYVKLSRVLAESWTGPFQFHRTKSTMDPLAEDEIRKSTGIEYNDFRKGMYTPHVGELTMKLEDIADKI